MAEPVDLIFYNKVMDRIGVKQLISRLISHFGITYTTHILDQSKTLGFQYATSSPISLGIDDLLTAPSKGWPIKDAEQYTNLSEKHHNYGNLHAVEKLRQLIETWYATSEYLKQEMNPNFRMTDPSNPVHMMSFSGARGSISQVHQLVGMRGLMSDPQGQIIDLPIQSNFREGLSLTEYIISCYGARKGVVDTAVRTSDAGYSTRRLVEVVQRIVIRKMDRGSIYGISVDDFRGKKAFFQQKVIGRVLAENIYINNRCFATRNQDIGASLANRLINLKTEQSICIRSPLTCKSMFWVCQSCYGWSLTNGNLIEMGEAVGIIAGQSIGEPGTQLTLRTFHTGGVFTGDIAEHVRTPFNGIIKFDENSIHPTRNRHGHPAWICHTNLFLKIQSRNKIHNITIPPKSLLLVQNNQYVESKQVIAEVRAKLLPFKEKVQKYIYSNLEGEMYWSTKVRHASDYIHSNIHTILETSHIWILSGKYYKKSEKLPILFYENQDKIDSKTFIAEEKNNISFLGDKNQINISIFNFWIFRRNRISKKSKLIYTIFNNWNNLINSNIILSRYNVAKRDRTIFLHEKDTTPFVLEIKKDGILQNNNVFAIPDPPKYKLDKSGIPKYGTIRIGSINRSNFEKTKNFRPKYTIIQGGSFFFIPEEIYFSTRNLSSLLIKNNNFIEAGTLITSSVISHMSGLAKIGKGINDNYEIKILPGTIYYPKKFHEISKQISVLIPPGKKIFDELRCNDWSYLQWIMPAKQKPFALIRPAIKYEISDEYSKTNLLDLLRRNTNLKIKSVSYSFYQDGEQIRILNRKYIQLVQTCLIVQWKEKYFLGKAHMSFLRIRTKNNVRTFIQISLINSVLISNRDNLKKNLSTRDILRKNFYDISPPSPNKKQLVSEHQGIIRISSNKNDGIKTFIILSPSNLVGISKINKSPELFIEKTTSYCISNKFFDFHKYQEDFYYYDHAQKTDIKKDKSIQDSIKIRLFDDVGFIGDSVNIKNSLECFYWFVNTKKTVDDSPIRIDKKYAENFQDPKWYFIDEYHKIYKFIFEINTNQSLFKWCLRIFPFGERILQKFNLGKFFFDNSSRSKYLENNPSGQIIGINTNYLIIRLAKPYLATRGAIIRNNYGEFVKEGDILITLIYERLKSGDIIQGLPKVEQLPEARPINSVSINLENSFEDWNNDMKKFIGNLWGFFLSTKMGMEKGQVILVDQIQKVYQSQGVHVSNKHIEIIVRQMTSKVITLEEGTINIFLPGEPIESSRARKMNRILEEPIPYEPILLGITKASLNTQSFISEASFQETTRVLAKSALKGRIDWLKGLKENVILGGIIPAGTGSQEVIWQMNLENRREVFSSKNGSYFNKKMKNIFLYQNKFFVYPAMETIHNVLKGAIFRNELDISSIGNNKI